MKKSELRNIIRESITEFLNESPWKGIEAGDAKLDIANQLGRYVVGIIKQSNKKITVLELKDRNYGKNVVKFLKKFYGLKSTVDHYDEKPVVVFDNNQIMESLNEVSPRMSSGTGAGVTWQLDDRKYVLTKPIDSVKVGDYIVTLPKGTIIWNLKGGVFAKHPKLDKQLSNTSVRKDKKFGVGITKSKETLNKINKYGTVVESLNEAKLPPSFDISKEYHRGKVGTTSIGKKNFVMYQTSKGDFFAPLEKFDYDEWKKGNQKIIAMKLSNDVMDEKRFSRLYRKGSGMSDYLDQGGRVWDNVNKYGTVVESLNEYVQSTKGMKYYIATNTFWGDVGKVKKGEIWASSGKVKRRKFEDGDGTYKVVDMWIADPHWEHFEEVEPSTFKGSFREVDPSKDTAAMKKLTKWKLVNESLNEAAGFDAKKTAKVIQTDKFLKQQFKTFKDKKEALKTIYVKYILQDRDLINKYKES